MKIFQFPHLPSHEKRTLDTSLTCPASLTLGAFEKETATNGYQMDEHGR